MKRYTQSPAPRVGFALTALALTALTFGLTVFAPAQSGSPASDAIPVAIVPSRIDVIAVRTPILAEERAAQARKSGSDPDYRRG